MQSTFEDLARAAEDHYLQPTEMNSFKQQVDALQDRLTVYEAIRDHELVIFQTIADQLHKEPASNSPSDIEKVLTHWIAVLRYSAMAMLMDQPEVLTDQLGWLTDVVSGDEYLSLHQHISELLHQCLHSVLAEDQIMLIEPFLQPVDAALFSEDSNRELVVLG
ncbi:hypothetical protein [Acaryochloris sp. IP29b_bin.148]|uniref:hypothetical protein n=1 Tax=Acaryochloris sp. IP29b_bin.148 TaxID=2969218 RepID=UPI0026301EE1|nr:hypothetical protein [Acaryochloris sp. IP29b_bin.148]